MNDLLDNMPFGKYVQEKAIESKPPTWKQIKKIYDRVSKLPEEPPTFKIAVTQEGIDALGIRPYTPLNCDILDF